MFDKVRVFVAGDLMLDRFEYGKVSRISPEAPVPVFRYEREREMLGGVGNVAANLISLGCKVMLLGAVGGDAAGRKVAALVKKSGAMGILQAARGYQTIVKTRLIAGNNHLLRADQESEFGEISIGTAQLARAEKAIAASDVVLISDYAKGFLSRATCRALLAAATKARKPVLIDPKGTDWEKYRGATLVKPNLKELSLVCGERFDAHRPDFIERLVVAARGVCRKFGLRNLLVTLSENGMLLVPASTRLKPMHVPTEAREVFDVSGAGDTALAAFGAAVGAGKSLAFALRVANAASGIVVSKLGTATVSSAELERALGDAQGDDPFAIMRRKIVTTGEIRRIAAIERAKGRRVGFTNGCFDCCHLGHLYSLVEAKKRCDVLVVGVNSDASVRRHKGPTRPIQDEATRTMNLAANSLVDYVVLFEEDVPLRLVKAVRPDVIAKEGYPLPKWPEGRLVKQLGGEAVVLPRLEGYSTTALVERMGK